jgi:hypothetical protein
MSYAMSAWGRWWKGEDMWASMHAPENISSCVTSILFLKWVPHHQITSIVTWFYWIQCSLGMKKYSWQDVWWHQLMLDSLKCGNLIPGMGMRKQNLLTCALAAAITFEILSLWSYALRETTRNSIENRFLKYLAVTSCALDDSNISKYLQIQGIF